MNVLVYNFFKNFLFGIIIFYRAFVESTKRVSVSLYTTHLVWVDHSFNFALNVDQYAWAGFGKNKN